MANSSYSLESFCSLYAIPSVINTEISRIKGRQSGGKWNRNENGALCPHKLVFLQWVPIVNETG